MAKKKFKLDLGKILTLAAMVLALVAFFMMFAPAITSVTDISPRIQARRLLSDTVKIVLKYLYFPRILFLICF